MLAIIIPYFKLTFFDETLQSLANQTDQRFKVYIGDDASPEDCTPLLEKYKGQFDFDYHRFESNLGSKSLTKQWERCIALSGDEEWLMILGDDDVLGATVVEEFYKQYDIIVGNTNMVRFATKIIFEETKTISELYTHPVWERATNSYFRKYRGMARSSLSEYIFSKSTYIKYGFIDYPLGWHSDDKAWLDFSDNKMIFSINESIVFIRISNSSISGKLDNKDLKYISGIHFLKDVILQNLKLFDKRQRLELLLDYEVKIKLKRKLILEEWKMMFQFYLKNFRVVPFFKLLRRVFIAFFNL